MRYIIEFTDNNAAFEESPAAEVRYVLLQVPRIIAERQKEVESTKHDERHGLLDSNGNSVGHVRLIIE